MQNKRLNCQYQSDYFKMQTNECACVLKDPNDQNKTAEHEADSVVSSPGFDKSRLPPAVQTRDHITHWEALTTL